MLIDAIVLSGGRSSRVDSLPKSEFLVGGRTLLQRTLDAASSTRRIVVVGPKPVDELPDAVLLTREKPPFSGPVAGIAAGLDALAEASSTVSDATLVLACDMPYISRAVAELVSAFADQVEIDGILALDDTQRRQPLAALYATNALSTAARRRRQEGSLDSLPVFALLDGLALSTVAVPVDATADVDTWDDAKRLAATAPPKTTAAPATAHERVIHE